MHPYGLDDCRVSLAATLVSSAAAFTASKQQHGKENVCQVSFAPKQKQTWLLFCILQLR
jgi:hypothetical protein